MKSFLKSLVLSACLPFTALAADQSTPMADIEPKPLHAPSRASQAAMLAEEAPAPAMGGSASDDFAFVNKDPKGNAALSGSEVVLPHLEGF